MSGFPFGNISGLVNGTESVVASYIVSGSPVASIDLGSVFNGDEDGWYTVIARHVYNTSNSTLNLYFNTDNAAGNYGYRGISSNNTTVANISSTSSLIRLCSVSSGTTTGFSVLRIYATQGVVRMCNGINICDLNATTVTQIETIGSVYSVTNTNLTKMVLVPSAGNIGVGAEVYVLKFNNFTGGTPCGSITTPSIAGCWTRVDSRVLAAATSSVTFSGLDGNTAVLYYITAQQKSNSAGSAGFAMSFSNMSGSIFGQQQLDATNTTVSGIRYTGQSELRLYDSASSVNNYGFLSALMFAKSGFVRPIISTSIDNITTAPVVSELNIQGSVINDTTHNVTDITLNDRNGGGWAIGSQFDLYALYK